MKEKRENGKKRREEKTPGIAETWKHGKEEGTRRQPPEVGITRPPRLTPPPDTLSAPCECLREYLPSASCEYPRE